MLALRAKRVVSSSICQKPVSRGYARLLKGQRVTLEKPLKPAVLMFTGQGSQWAGMGKDLAKEWKEARDVFEEVDDALRITLSRIMFEGMDSELSPTEIAQPAILAHGMAVMAILRKELGKDPIKASCALLGHSVGEVTAFVASEAMPLSIAAKFVHERGMFMQSATPKDRKTGMVSFFPMNFTQAKALITEVHKEIPEAILDIACLNSPKNIVLSGDADALEYAIQILATPEFGVKSKAIRLDVSAPFHSRYMQTTHSILTKNLSAMKMRVSTAPVISGLNHTLQRQVPDHLIENFVPLTSDTVNFMGAIEQANNILHTQSQTIEKALWLEIGPKPTLSSFVSQTLDGVTPLSLCSAKDIRDLLKNKEAVSLLIGANKSK